jgi:hypothetical protein
MTTEITSLPISPPLPRSAAPPGLIERIFRSPGEFFAEIAAQERLNRMMRSMLIQSVLCFALYGAVMGITHSPLQALYSALKLPLLYLLTLVVCLPSLYFFNILLGSRLWLPQVLALSLTAITVTAALSASLAPITLFFWLSGRDYHFALFLNVVFLAITGAIGLIFLVRGMHQIDRIRGLFNLRWPILLVWMTLYGFVGTQMAWILRPFMGTLKEVLPFVPPGGNFYIAVWDTIWQLLQR